MPSSKYVAMTPKGRLTSLSETNKSSQIAGGAVTLLLKNIVKAPIAGAGLNEPAKSNIMVGTITPQGSSKITTGGELLNKLQNLKFGKGKANRNQSNIKFIF